MLPVQSQTAACEQWERDRRLLEAEHSRVTRQLEARLLELEAANKVLVVLLQKCHFFSISRAGQLFVVLSIIFSCICHVRTSPINVTRPILGSENLNQRLPGPKKNLTATSKKLCPYGNRMQVIQIVFFLL